MQSQVRFNRVPENVLEKVSEKVGEALVQSQVVVRRRFQKVPEKVWEGLFGAKPSQVQQGSGEGSKGSGKGLGGLVQS